MRFYIDESGNENPSAEFVFGFVASVVFKENAIANWNEKYVNLGKGKDLNEEQAQEILQYLAGNGVKAFIVGTNCKSYSKTIAEAHRDDYILSVDTVTKGVNPIKIFLKDHHDPGVFQNIFLLRFNLVAVKHI